MQYGRQFGLRMLVETGTFLGDMIFACRREFDAIISIEVSPYLYALAHERLKRYSHVTLLLGDSGQQIETALDKVTQPALFWLDAHYSGGITGKSDLESPIFQELQMIFNHPIKDHVILIDDARCFTGQNDYPTLAGVRDIVQQNYAGHQMTVENDIIRILPI